MTELLIVGARAHAREIHDAALAMAAGMRVPWQFGGFIADGDSHPEKIAERGERILGDLGIFDTRKPDEVEYVIGTGSPADRKRIDQELSRRGFRAAVIVHPRANVGTLVRFQPGCYVAVGANITTQIELGRHAHINTGAVVSHDCVIGDYAIVGPNASVAGGVKIEEGAYIGIGASIRENLVIGPWSTVGLGSAVVKDVHANITVAGNPARPLTVRGLT